MWAKATQKDGYGILTFQGKGWLANRLAWTLANGAIPADSCVCHTCDTPACCNPAHLFLGSHSENMADMKTKGRRKSINAGSFNGRAKLNEAQASDIRSLYATGDWRQVDLAEKFGCSQTIVSLIIRNVNWST